MSSVTRLHLLSQSMLNVSCQKQKRCSSLPTDCPTESPMEFVGQSRPSGACSLLGVPGLSSLDVDDDECEVVIGIRPKSSPLPRRRSSASDEDSEPEPPASGSRRVSFADAQGLSLVQVKEFDTWDVPKLPGFDSSEGEGKDAEEYFLSPLTFSLPLSTEELFVKVREQKVELETIELLPGTTILKGVIRVLNISFNKVVYVRTTLDTWSSHFDLLAEYMPSSSDSLMDCFSFKLTLVPPFGEQGARVDFCLRYETPLGTFWANNNNRNYVLFCHKQVKERKEKPQKKNVNKKSCLKILSQNFSTVENISAMEASSQGTISTAVSKHEEEAHTMKARQISDGQSGTTEEDRQKLLIENRQNCRRRSRRKAARMGRVRDHFSQKNGGADDAERDESPQVAKQVAQEETQEEKHSDMQPFPDGSRGSEGSESLETCSEPLLDVLHDMSPAHGYTSISETEKSESIDLGDSAALTGGESITDIPDDTSNDEPTSAECQNIYKSVSKAEESNIAAEPADSVISAMSSESLASRNSSFTFGTVLAPLYHQVFGKVGNENQSVCDWGKPVRATLNVGDVTQSYLHTERSQSSCTISADTRGNNEEVQGNAIKIQESNQQCLDAVPNSPPVLEEEMSLSGTTNDILDHAETLQDPVDIKDSDQSRTNTSNVPKTNSGDTDIQPNAVNILNTDLLNPQIPTESFHLQEDGLTHDLQLPEHTCTQTNLDETPAQSEPQEVMTSLEGSFMSLHPSQSVSECVSDETDEQTSSGGANHCKCVHESNKDNDVDKTVTISTTSEDKLLEGLHDLNPNHINNSATKETESSYISCFETVEEKDVPTPQMSNNNVEEGNKVVNNFHKGETKYSAEIKVIGESTTSNHAHGDVFMEPKDEDTRKIEHHEMEAGVSKQGDFCEVKNWEMMVEEEEQNILTDEEESGALSLKIEDTEAVEKHRREQLEDTGRETSTENRDTTETEKEETEDEMLEITAAREKENEDEHAGVLEDKQEIREKEIWEIMAGKDREEVEKDFVQATKTAGEEELCEETEEEERQEKTELEKEKHLTETQEINVGETNVEDEEEIEGEKEMEMNDEYEADEEWEDQVNPRKENAEENPDYNEKILIDETVTSEIVDAASDSMTTEDRENATGYDEERSDIAQNRVEDGLSALADKMQDKRVSDKENTREQQNGYIPTEMHHYKEEDSQSNENVTHDLSRAERDKSESVAAEGGSQIFTDEPESDQASHNSTSAESDSDDEVELYMHCLRAVHTGTQAQKDRNKETGFSVGKRPSVSKCKLLSTPMPSISESLDEEQHLSRLLDNHEDTETPDIQPTAASSGQESISKNVAWWKETFSCSNISKTLLYAALLVAFLVVAYRYDFLACFGLYLITVVWLYCHGGKQPEQQKQQQNRLN